VAWNCVHCKQKRANRKQAAQSSKTHIEFYDDNDDAAADEQIGKQSQHCPLITAHCLSRFASASFVHSSTSVLLPLAGSFIAGAPSSCLWFGFMSCACSRIR